MRKIEYIVVHCSDSPWGDVEEIRKWHLARGWRDIGYNAVITNGYLKNSKDYDLTYDGELQVGRGLNLDSYIDASEVGAHALGYNRNSIGICLIGTNHFSRSQLETLIEFCRLFKKITDVEIIGHYETKRAGGKTCPNIDMEKLRLAISETGMSAYHAGLIVQP